MIRRVFQRIKRMREGDEFTSLGLRKKFSDLYGIEVGLFSYGCFDPSRIGRNTKFGRYCSIAPSAHIFRRNHGIEFIGLTPYLYNPRLGVVEEEIFEFKPLEIGDDVWMGHNCIILPSVSKVGRGAILAAGAVVTSDVEPYAIVGGNPAKEIRKRFSPEVIAKIEESRWWEMTPDEIKQDLKARPDRYFSPQTGL